MPVYSYNTIQEPAEGYFKDSGSRFLAFAFPVSSETEIKNHLLALRKKYFDARHHGYAYMLGPEQKSWRAFDDGEPNHSTGDPILGQIKSRNLTNVLVVVVRYFGGTKLGVSGLITAYRSAANDALSRAVIITRDVVVTLKMEFDFSATPVAMKLIKDYQVAILEQVFTDKTVMKLEVKLKLEKQLRERVALLKATGSGIEISPGVGDS
jgi:uncharacterized YigZ family protein